MSESNVHTVVVVDYGMGNLRSVFKALEHVRQPNQRIVISADPAVVASASRVVLPGQGAMPDCMRELRESGLLSAVLDAAATRPLLGVCIGEQMLFQTSEEGPTEGLGLLPGLVRRFDPALSRAHGLKVPHMGWNRVTQIRPHALWEGIEDHAYFYFVHSYYVCPDDPTHSVGQTSYGTRFTSAGRAR